MPLNKETNANQTKPNQTHTHTHTHTHTYTHTHLVLLEPISLNHSLYSSLPSIIPGRSSRLNTEPHRTVAGKFLWTGQPWQVHVKGLFENVTYDFVLVSPAVSRKSCSSYFDVFIDEMLVAVKLLFQELFNMAHSILVQISAVFLSIHLFSVHVCILTVVLIQPMLGYIFDKLG